MLRGHLPRLRPVSARHSGPLLRGGPEPESAGGQGPTRRLLAAGDFSTGSLSERKRPWTIRAGFMGLEKKNDIHLKYVTNSFHGMHGMRPAIRHGVKRAGRGHRGRGPHVRPGSGMWSTQLLPGDPAGRHPDEASVPSVPETPAAGAGPSVSL